MSAKTLLASIVTAGAILAATLLPAASASAACVDGPVWWPTTGNTATQSTGTQRSITLNFKLTQAQLNALACKGGYLKLEFPVQNAGVSGGNYTVSSNISGGVIKNIPVLANTFVPGAIIGLGGLQAGTNHYVTVSWTGGTANPTFKTDWVGAHQASTTMEKQQCRNGQAQGTNSWCYFQTGLARHTLTNGYVPLNGTSYPVQ